MAPGDDCEGSILLLLEGVDGTGRDVGCGMWDVGDKTASGDGDSRSSGSIQEVLGISSAVCIPCGFLSHYSSTTRSMHTS